MEAKNLRLHSKVTITQKARKELWEQEMDIKPLSTGFITSIDIDECRIMLDGMEIEMYYEDLEPIPLTEEWLLKFGFKRIDHIHGYSFYNLKHINLDVYLDRNKAELRSSPIPKKIKYVNQLQNLFFALTGSELELKVSQ